MAVDSPGPASAPPSPELLQRAVEHGGGQTFAALRTQYDFTGNASLASGAKDVRTPTPEHSEEHYLEGFSGVLRDATADPGGCIVGLANIAGGEVVAIEASGLLLQTGFTAAQTAVLMSKGALALFDKPTGKVGVIIDAEVCGHCDGLHTRCRMGRCAWGR